MPGRAGVDAMSGPLVPGERTGPLLTVTGLSRGFGQVEVLDGVDLQVGWGEAVTVTGPNGSGKTTLLRCVTGADRLVRGRSRKLAGGGRIFMSGSSWPPWSDRWPSDRPGRWGGC
jgi:ABC-type sugar transport system ATPase subunit